MMYIHYCDNCFRLHILNGHKALCPACKNKLIELKMSYLSYVELNATERQTLLNNLKYNEQNIKNL